MAYMWFDVIAACDLCGFIGKDGSIPWHIPEDLIRFKNITTDCSNPYKLNAVIMGRKTWESLPKGYLPNRFNIVLSSTLSNADMPPLSETFGAPVIVCRSFESALNLLDRRKCEVEHAFVIGGSGLYKDAILHPQCRYVHVTFVHDMIRGCDARFPIKALTDMWEEDTGAYSGVLKSEDRDKGRMLYYSYHMYKREYYPSTIASSTTVGPTCE
jgi:dihydrofolate reductase